MKSIWLCLFFIILLTTRSFASTCVQRQADQQPPAKAVEQKKNPPPAKTQSPVDAEAKHQKERPSDIVFFISNIRSAPPEFAADLLIRLAESNKIDDAEWKLELLDEAFHLASNAQQPFKRQYASWNPIDTRAGYLGYAFEHNLDALSLQGRAVTAMLAIDRQKARSLFKEIIKLDLKPIACEEGLIYDLSGFYALLANIAQTTFNAKEIRRNERVYFLETYISSLVSATQVGPISDALASINLESTELERLLHTFSTALGGIPTGDRAFWFTEQATGRSLSRLLNAGKERNLAVDELLASYRAYLMKQFSGNRCADPYRWLKGAQSDYIAVFNKQLRLKSAKELAPIAADEIQPAKIDGDEKAFLYWQSAKAKGFLAKLKILRFGNTDKPLTQADQETAAWRIRLNDFLNDLNAWRKEDEPSEEDYFHQKCFLYVSLLQFIPPSITHDEILKNYVAFLNEFDVQRGSRIEWFWQADYIIKVLLSIQGEARAKLITMLGVPKSPILYLYAELGTYAPQSHT